MYRQISHSLHDDINCYHIFGRQIADFVIRENLYTSICMSHTSFTLGKEMENKIGEEKGREEKRREEKCSFYILIVLYHLMLYSKNILIYYLCIFLKKF